MTSLQERLLGLLTTLALVAFAAGFPALLTLVGLSPTSIAGHPVWAQLLEVADWNIVWVGLGIMGWGVWAVLVYCLLVELIAAVRNVHAPELRGLSLPQHTARTLIAWAALLFVTASTSAPFAAAAGGSEVPAIAAAAPLRSDTVALPAAPVAAPVTHAGFAAAPAPAPAAPRAAQTGTIPYTVVRGDTLWKIAETMLGDPLRYPEIAALNRDVLGDEPDFITPGMQLFLPSDARTEAPFETAGTVVVEPGDTLSQIALDELGDASRYPEIFEASNDMVQPDGARLTDPDLIRPGWELTLPGSTKTDEADAAAMTRQPPSAGPEAPEPAATAPTDGTSPPPPKAQPSTPAPSASPLAPAPTTPSQPLPQAPPSVQSVTPESTSGWLLPALTGAGAVLAGVLHLVLRGNRRSQLRFRTPGMLIAPEPGEVAPVDRTTRIVGGPAAPRLQALDRLLRSLASAFVDPTRYPPLLAVELTADTATLHLAEDVTLPEPWTGAGMRWTVQIDADVPDPDTLAPYPMLVSVGADDAGTLWLLNLERFGVLNVVGTPAEAQRFGRHVAAELALSPWSTLVQVHTLGFGEELADLDEFRLMPYPAGDTSALEAITRSARNSQSHDPEELHVVVIAAGAGPAQDTAQITEAIHAHDTRPGVAVVTLADIPSQSVAVLEVDGSHLRVPALGIKLRAPGLTQTEATAIAEIVRVTRNRTNVRAPVDELLTEGYGAFMTATGALREPLVGDRPAPDQPGGPTSLLPEQATAYTEVAATTEDDVAALAPPVPKSTTEAVLAADPTLDDDLRLWRMGDKCPVPRVMLLGKLRVTAHGVSQEVSERKHHYIELLTYLWSHPHGVTAATLADEFGYKRERARVEISHLRKYLGTDPRTGESYLPTAPGTRERTQNGWTGYTLRGVLFDVDLFRRLRVRGQARGAHGLPDLVAALHLVRGEPFADLRADSWTWMFEGERLDQEFAAAIIDVAHLVATRSMKDGDLPTARRAAEIALSASPYDEISRLDLARVAELEGNHAEAAQIRGEGIFRRTDDYRAPLDPGERTEKITAASRRPGNR
ncbi:LysM peptidoglycan-binding domain-containing protein [Georgenia sp. H159]|uniref:LysM peptidoglycan-binding domain-containing protein n=1 Tax=Georgenia sp. H159 TaxID=3076115 RepID=UPI002D78041D|nr:LysM peptidoglycan-binding domain-containing protein [Georgenia sp. H159]